MRKSILALILSLSLLTVTSAFILTLPIDEAVQQTYDFSVDRLEHRGRVSIGAESGPLPTVVSVSGAFFIAQATPGVTPSLSVGTQPVETPVHGRPPLSLTLILLGLCCFFLLFIGIFILGFVVRRQSIKEWKNDQQSNSG